MKKTLDVLQSICGVIVLISFIGIFIGGLVFKRLEYASLFGTLFFIFLPISMGLNVFTRKKRFSLGLYIAMGVFLIFGLISLYYTIQLFSTTTVYEVNLTEFEGGYAGNFKVPENVLPDNQTHLLYLSLTYTFSGLSGVGETVNLNFSGPNLNRSKEIYLTKRSRNGQDISSVTTNIDLGLNFIPREGEYTFTLSPEDNSSHLIIKEVRILIKRYR